MRCGKCKNTGVNIAHVRSCYGVGPHGGVMTDTHKEEGQGHLDGTRAYRPRVRSTNPPTEPMVNYVIGLQDERVMEDGYQLLTAEELRNVDYRDVSDLITALKGRPYKSGGGNREWTMPAGRYALLGDDQVWRFYQVDKPKEGRWRGYTFLKQLFGAPGDYRKENIRNTTARNAVLARIEEDPKTAAIDYGMQHGACSICGSPLTNADSIAAGIGPVCQGKVGW